MANDKTETLKGRDRFRLVSRSAILRNVAFSHCFGNESRDLSIHVDAMDGVKAMDVRHSRVIEFME